MTRSGGWCAPRRVSPSEARSATLSIHGWGVSLFPLVIDGTIYYVDQLGTMFARDAKTGRITDPQKHWTATLVIPIIWRPRNRSLPDLYYTAPAATQTHIWIRSSVNGRVHAVRRIGGQEEDFDPNTPRHSTRTTSAGPPLSSNLGEPVIVHVDANGRVVDALSHAGEQVTAFS